MDAAKAIRNCLRLPDSRRFRIGSSRVGNQIDSTLPTPSQSRMKQITRAQALKNRIQLRLRRALMTQPPSDAVPIPLPEPIRVPVRDRVGEAPLHRWFLAGQRGL